MKLSAAAWSRAVPEEMRALPRWCGWRVEKRPLDPRDGSAARVDDPATWGTFEDAVRFYRQHEEEPDAGAGFVFTRGDGLVFLDLDHCLDGEGKVKPWAASLVGSAAYHEVSPSGTGLHVFVLGELPRAEGVSGGRVAVEDGAVEVYAERRFSTVTGRHWRRREVLAAVPLDAFPLPAALREKLTRAAPPPSQAREPLGRRLEVWEAMRHLDPDLPHDEWVRVGMALKAAFGDGGLPLWVKWSSGGKKFKKGEPEQRWRSFRRSGVGLGTVFRMAREAGWAPPRGGPEEAFADWAPRDDDLRIIPASQQPREHYEWLWRRRLARGHLTLVAGKPKQGKSIVTLDTCARLSRGAALPGEPRAEPPTRVLLLNAEDGQGDTIRPRLEAAGADLDKVGILDLRGGGRIPQLPDDVGPLGRALEAHGPAQLVVLDPLSAFLSPDLDEHKGQDMRTALAPLFALAQQTRVAFMLVVHFNKARDMDAVERIGGSIAIAAQARLILGVGRRAEDEDDPDAERVVVPLGGNLGPDSAALGFQVVPWERDPDVGVVRWNAGETRASGGDLVRRLPAGSGKVGEAEAWLRSRLAAGPVASRVLEADAKAAGLSYATINRAAARLGLRRERDELAGGWRWPKVEGFTEEEEACTRRTRKRGKGS